MHEKNQKLSHRLESKFKKKKRLYIYIFLCARVIPFPHREFLRQLRTVVIWSCEVQFPPVYILKPSLLWISPPQSAYDWENFFFGCVCACVSLVAAPRKGKGLPWDSLEPQLFPSGLTWGASGYNMFTYFYHFCFFSWMYQHACMCACINVWNKYVCKDC